REAAVLSILELAVDVAHPDEAGLERDYDIGRGAVRGWIAELEGVEAGVGVRRVGDDLIDDLARRQRLGDALEGDVGRACRFEVLQGSNGVESLRLVL